MIVNTHCLVMIGLKRSSEFDSVLSIILVSCVAKKYYCLAYDTWQHIAIACLTLFQKTLLLTIRLSLLQVLNAGSSETEKWNRFVTPTVSIEPYWHNKINTNWLEQSADRNKMVKAHIFLSLRYVYLEILSEKYCSE